MTVTLTKEHFGDARLFLDRKTLILHIAQEQVFESICEVGVARGDFSKWLISNLRPRRFGAIDQFELHMLTEFWGKSVEEHFNGLEHRAFFEKTVAPVAAAAGTVVEVLEGDSWDCLARCPEDAFDMIYLDAAHDYEAVSRDATAAARAIRPGGVVIFNDYIMYDHIVPHPYGVVQAANEFIVQHDCQVLGLGLHPEMFCDLAVRVP